MREMWTANMQNLFDVENWISAVSWMFTYNFCVDNHYSRKLQRIGDSVSVYEPKEKQLMTCYLVFRLAGPWFHELGYAVWIWNAIWIWNVRSWLRISKIWIRRVRIFAILIPGLWILVNSQELKPHFLRSIIITVVSLLGTLESILTGTYFELPGTKLLYPILWLGVVCIQHISLDQHTFPIRCVSVRSTLIDSEPHFNFPSGFSW